MLHYKGQCSICEERLFVNFSWPAGDSNPQPVVTRNMVFTSPTLYLLSYSAGFAIPIISISLLYAKGPKRGVQVDNNKTPSALTEIIACFAVSLENIVRERKIFLINIFSFPTIIPLSYIIPEFVVCGRFRYRRVQYRKINGKGIRLTLSQTTNFRHIQTERVCRQKKLNLMNMAESPPKG